MSGKPPKYPEDVYQMTAKSFRKNRLEREAKVVEKQREKERQKEKKEQMKRNIGIAETQKNKKGGSHTTRRTLGGDRGGDIVTHMLAIRNQVKLYHWQTKQFARHKATDDLTASLDLNIDAFVESYMGRYGRPSVSGSIKLHNFSESAAKNFVARETKFLTVDLPKKLKPTDTDLLNIRDTILGDLTKTLYLFSLT